MSTFRKGVAVVLVLAFCLALVPQDHSTLQSKLESQTRQPQRFLSNSYSTVVTGALPQYTFGSSTGGGFVDSQSSNDVYHTSTSTTYVSTSTSQTLATAAAQSGTDWNSLQYIYTVAGSYTYGGANPTGYVWGYNYGFSLPSDAVILGVVFYTSHATTVASSYKDANIYLRDNNGAAVGTNHADTGTYWSTTLELWYTYGSSTDDWSAGLTPSIVNSGNFGVEVSASRGATASTAYVKQFYLTIYYKVYAKIDLYYSFQFVAASRDYVSALSWGAEGKTSSPNVEIYIWNWGTSVWDDTTQYWTTVEATKTASVAINSYMDSQGNLRMRFSVYAISTTFTISADYLYWSVTWRTPLAVPTLVNPSNNSIVTARPKLEWNAIQLNNGNPYWYHIQVSTVIGFGSTVLNATAENSWYNVTSDLVVGLKYWRVRGIAVNNSIGSWSGVFRFTVDNVAPSAPTLMNPGNATTAYTLRPILEWNAVTDDLSNPPTYHYQLSSDKTFVSMIWFNSTTTKTWFNVSVDLSTSFTYYWRVRAVDTLGNIGSWSGVYQFTVTSEPSNDVTLYLSYWGLDGWPLSFGFPKTFINDTRYSNTPMLLSAFLNKHMNLTTTDYFDNIVFQKTNYLLNTSVTWLDVQLQLVSTTLKAYDLSQMEIFGNVTWSDNFNSFTPGVGWNVAADAGGYTVAIDNGRVKLTTASGVGHYVYIYSVGSYGTKSTLTVWWRTDVSAWGSLGVTGSTVDLSDYWGIISSAGNLQVWSRLGAAWAYRDTLGAYAANTWYKFTIVIDSDSVDVSLYNSNGSLNDVSTVAFDTQSGNWRFKLQNSYSDSHSTWYDLFILQGGMGYSKTIAFDTSVEMLFTPQNYVFNGTAWNGAIRFQTSATISVSLNRVVQLSNIPLIISSVQYSDSSQSFAYAISANKPSPPLWFKIYDNTSLIVPTTYALSGVWPKSTVYGWHNLTIMIGDDVGYEFNFTNSYFVDYRYITFEFYSTIDGLGLDPGLFQLYVNGSRVWDSSNYRTTGINVFVQVFDYYMNSFYSGVSPYSRVIQIGLGYYEAGFFNNGENNIILNMTSNSYALNFQGNFTGDTLVVPYSPSFTFSSQITVALWVWQNSTTQYFNPWVNQWGGLAAQQSFHIAYYNGIGIIFYMRDNGGGIHQLSFATPVFNTWLRYVFTYDGQRQRGYLNGALVTAGGLDVFTMQSASYQIGVGYIPSYNEIQNGRIADVVVATRAWGSTEVQFDYNNKQIQNLNGILLRLKINEGTGTVVYDISGYGNNGAISAASMWHEIVSPPFVPVKSTPVGAHGSSTIRMIAKGYSLVGFGIRQDSSIVQFTTSTITVSDVSKTFIFKDLTTFIVHVTYYDLDGSGRDFVEVQTWINGTRVATATNSYLGSGHIHLNITVGDYLGNILSFNWYTINSTPYYQNIQLQLVSTTLKAYDLTKVEIWGNVTISDTFTGADGSAPNAAIWTTQLTGGAGDWQKIYSNRLRQHVETAAGHWAYVTSTGYQQMVTETVWMKTGNVAWESVVIPGLSGDTWYFYLEPSGGGTWYLYTRQGGLTNIRAAGGTCVANVWYKFVITLTGSTISLIIYNSDGSVNWAASSWFDSIATTWTFRLEAIWTSGAAFDVNWDMWIIQGNTGYSKTLTFDGSADTLLTPDDYVFNGTAWNGLIRFQTNATIGVSLNRVIKLCDVTATAYIKYVNANDPNLAAIQPINFNTKYYVPSIGAWRWLSPYSPSVIMLVNEKVNFTVYDNLGSIVVSNQQYAYNETIQLSVNVWNLRIIPAAEYSAAIVFVQPHGASLSGGIGVTATWGAEYMLYPGLYDVKTYFNYTIMSGHIVPIEMWINGTYTLPGNINGVSTGRLLTICSGKILDIMDWVNGTLVATQTLTYSLGSAFYYLQNATTTMQQQTANFEAYVYNLEMYINRTLTERLGYNPMDLSSYANPTPVWLDMLFGLGQTIVIGVLGWMVRTARQKFEEEQAAKAKEQAKTNLTGETPSYISPQARNDHRRINKNERLRELGK